MQLSRSTFVGRTAAAALYGAHAAFIGGTAAAVYGAYPSVASRASSAERYDGVTAATTGSAVEPLLQNNRRFAASGAWRNTPRLPFLPHKRLYVITCVDPRVDPFEFLGLSFADAIVGRTVGGRISPQMIEDVSYIGYLVEQKAPDGPYFEVAIIHHTDCGSALLANPTIRQGFEKRTGYDDAQLTALPVLDPTKTVPTDVRQLLSDPRVSPRTTVSGHMYDVRTGLLTTLVGPGRPAA